MLSNSLIKKIDSRMHKFEEIIHGAHQ